MERAEKKAELRREFLAARTAFAKQHGARASDRITRSVLQLPSFQRAATVMLYVPFRHEVDTWGLMEAIGAAGKNLVLPATVPAERRMILRRVLEPCSELAVGNYGIMEPRAGALEVPIQDIQLVLTPGLAFDRRAHRLGYGGGYYDRLMASSSRTVTTFIGLAFDVQFTELVPVGPHDQPLDGVITERRVLLGAAHLDA